MASGRNVILGLTLAVLISTCSGSKQVQETPKPVEKEVAEVQTPVSVVASVDSVDIDLDIYRNSLVDPTAQKSNDLPEAYRTEESSSDASAGHLNQGFRIQLISTLERIEAEKVMSDFTAWLYSTKDISYKAEAYLLYKQPNYRVHVGDFKTRIQANEFVKIVKTRFNDAWIIQDMITEDRTPDKVN